MLTGKPGIYYRKIEQTQVIDANTVKTERSQGPKKKSDDSIK